MSTFGSVKQFFKASPKVRPQVSLTDAGISHILGQIQTLKSKDASYDSIELNRRAGSVTFFATTTLSKAEKEVLAQYYNEKMQYDGFVVNPSGQMVLTLDKRKPLGNMGALQLGINEAIETLKDPKTVNQTVNSAQAPLTMALKLGNLKKAAQILDQELSGDEKARSFQIAFNQGNLVMMSLLTDAGGYRPSPEMKNDKGVPLKQWLADQARGGDEATRAMLAQVEKKMEAPALTLNARSLAQLSAIQMDVGNWMGGISAGVGNALSLPAAPQRNFSLAV
jgi:hypothetical protein